MYSFVILVFYDSAHSITPSCQKMYKREQNFQLSLFICVFGQFITVFHILNFCFITFAFKMCIKQFIRTKVTWIQCYEFLFMYFVLLNAGNNSFYIV
jgi:hypothetical protein